MSNATDATRRVASYFSFRTSDIIPGAGALFNLDFSLWCLCNIACPFVGFRLPWHCQFVVDV